MGPDRCRQVHFWRRQSGSYRDLSGPRWRAQKELSGAVGAGRGRFSLARPETIYRIPSGQEDLEKWILGEIG